MAKVTFDYSKAESFISNDEVNSMKEIAENAKKVLVERTGAGNDFLGWIDLPVDYDKEEFDRIKKAAAKIQSDSEVLIVIGIGGSYLGARAAIEFLRHGFYNNVPKEVRKTPEIYYAGNSISPSYLQGLLDELEIEISQLTLFLSLVQQQNQLSLSEFSKKNWKRNMEKKKQQREFTLQQIRQRAPLKDLQQQKVMKAS